MVPGGGFDVEEAKMASEELRLESEIRSLEMQIGLMDMKRQIEVQEEHLQRWQQMLAKSKAGRLECEKLQGAQEELAQLRAKCAAIEAKRPPRLPSPPRAIPAEEPPPDEEACKEADAPEAAGKEAKVPIPRRPGSTKEAPAALKQRGSERSSRGGSARAAAAAAAAVVARGPSSGTRGGYAPARSTSGTR
ncbi:hdaC [Symbiodinium natans]|uniref:HdaC protein n=1 Tax=Symbiodinium natans TaxID=878477 RepID=A0A812MUA6_9DINO|nr:hdaC [Symbiodinium natans]